LIGFSQKIRIRSARFRLNKSDHVIGYSFFKEILSENIDDEFQKKLYFLEKTKSHLIHLHRIKDLLLMHQGLIEEPLKFFQMIENSLSDFKEGTFLHIYSFFLKARIFFTYEDFHRSLACLKSMETITAKDCYEEFRLFSCFHQGKNYQSLRMFKDALKYYLRSLQIAWMLKDKNQELLIYDHLGLVFYYLDNMEIARLFHEKMMLGKIEKDKDFKSFSINLYKDSVKNSALQKKVDKTFKKAIMAHLTNNIYSYDKPKESIDHKLNVELKRLEYEGKIKLPVNAIGKFIYKNEEVFKKRAEKKKKWLVSQNETEIHEQRVLTHHSYNRNHENFAVLGNQIDKYQRISYKSNKPNQRAVAKLMKRLVLEINNGLVDLEDFAGMLEKEILS